MTVKIPLMRSTFFREDETKEKLCEFIRGAKKLSMGEECLKFEQAFAQYHERRFCTLVSNGSAANMALIQALLNLGRLKRGDRVGVSAVTWATNVMPIMQLGLTPVAVDCELQTLNVSPRTFERSMKGLAAMFITNVLGFCDDIAGIEALCKKNGVILIEDNCESLGTRYKGKLLGNYGVASTCSFFVGHHLSTIEGGVIMTDDAELRDMLTMVRAHGWDRSLSEEKQQSLRKTYNVDSFHAKYTFYEPAYNVRPTEITGVLGSIQLPLLEEAIEKRIKNFTKLHAAAAKQADRYETLSCSHIERLSNFAMPLIARSEKIMHETIARFDAAGIENRPLIAGNIAEHPFWTRSLPKAECPNASIIHRRGFYIPNNHDLTEAEVDLMCSLL